MQLEELEIYRLSRKVGKSVWELYNKLNWQDKKTMGDQFLSSVDSIGANIAEGFGRYHYLDKNKFNYNARGSLLEATHWLEVLRERGKIEEELFDSLKGDFLSLHKGLNGYIYSTKQQKLKVSKEDKPLIT